MGANFADLNESNPLKTGVVVIDNKKRRTSDGPNQQHGPIGDTELFLGSDEDSVDNMDQHSSKHIENSKNVQLAGSGAGVRLSS